VNLRATTPKRPRLQGEAGEQGRLHLVMDFLPDEEEL